VYKVAILLAAGRQNSRKRFLCWANGNVFVDERLMRILGQQGSYTLIKPDSLAIPFSPQSPPEPKTQSLDPNLLT
jgi:hypothetical protein